MSTGGSGTVTLRYCHVEVWNGSVMVRHGMMLAWNGTVMFTGHGMVLSCLQGMEWCCHVYRAWNGTVMLGHRMMLYGYDMGRDGDVMFTVH